MTTAVGAMAAPVHRRQSWWAVLSSGELGACLFLACLYLSPAHWIPATAGLRPAWTAAALMTGAVVWRLWTGSESVRIGWPGIGMALLFLWVGASSLVAMDRAGAVQFAAESLKLPLAYVGLSVCLRDPAMVRRGLWVAVACALVPGWGTVDRYRHGIDLVEGFRGAWIGLLANPNQVAMVMAVTAPWALWLAVTSQRWARLAALASLAAMCSATVATHSRGGALALATGMLVSALLARRRARALSIVFVASIAVAALAPSSFWERTGTIAEYELDASAQGRLKAWQTGWRAVQERPLTGIGGGGYLTAWDRYTPRNIRERAYASHNVWMQVLVEFGVLGLGFFGLTVGALVLGLWRAARQPRWQGVARALLASLAALAAAGATGGYAFNWFFYAILGLAGAVGAGASADRRSDILGASTVELRDDGLGASLDGPGDDPAEVDPDAELDADPPPS